MVYYASRKLEAVGVYHGFSTRLGGVSPTPFDSLNLGNPGGCEIADDTCHIEENYQRFLTAIGAPGRMPLRVHQIHGNAVAHVENGRDFAIGAQADAIISSDIQRPISVRIADCVPILIASAHGRFVAAVHAGWRGVVANVIAATIDRLARVYDVLPVSLIAAIGPCISAAMFEVGPEVIAEFRKTFGDDFSMEPTIAGKGKVDLRRAVQLQLLASGLPRENVDVTDRCTASHRQEFFSHRRDHGVTGRMSAVIVANPSRMI